MVEIDRAAVYIKEQVDRHSIPEEDPFLRFMKVAQGMGHLVDPNDKFFVIEMLPARYIIPQSTEAHFELFISSFNDPREVVEFAKGNNQESKAAKEDQPVHELTSFVFDRQGNLLPEIRLDAA